MVTIKNFSDDVSFMYFSFLLDIFIRTVIYQLPFFPNQNFYAKQKFYFEESFLNENGWSLFRKVTKSDNDLPVVNEVGNCFVDYTGSLSPFVQF